MQSVIVTFLQEGCIRMVVARLHFCGWEKFGTGGTEIVGKVALGGSIGLGREAAKTFYALGATVVITSRSQARADALADYGGTIPPLAKRLPRLPVAFAQFLADSVKEYY
mgnify:CR=1 FL=1